jgi:hypothetical protein
MAPIGVQLVKDVLRLVNGTGWPARRSRRPGHVTPGAVMPADSGSGLRLVLALAGCHRDRRGPGAGRLRWFRSPGRSPERNRGQRCEKDEGQRDVLRHQVLHGAPPRYRRRLPQSCLVSWAGLPWHLRRHGQRRLAAPP